MSVFFDAVLVELFSTDIPRALNDIGSNDIKVFRIAYLDDLTVNLTLRNKDVNRLRVASKYIQSIKVVKHLGVVAYLRGLALRPVLVFTLLLIAGMSVYLPTRILFIDVTGNESVPRKAILEQAQQCGIGFWADRRSVRSEQVKNDLLERIPQLKWAAVTTSGSTATIHVQEEIPAEEISKVGVGHIVAACDGVIESISVTHGTALCNVGDAVNTGQLLVSGYTDCGLCIQATQAEGEIYAKTLREIEAVAIKPMVERGHPVRQEKRYCIQIGKKLIKLYKDSGISDTTCVKIYSQRSIHLPGNKELPVQIIEEQLQCFHPVRISDGWKSQWMANCVTQYIEAQMVGGRILESDLELTKKPDVYTLSGKYACNEMIGLLVSEENIEQYAEDN